MSARNFKTCGWAKQSKKGGIWVCKARKMNFRDHDIGIGICPCPKWVHIGGAVAPCPSEQLGLFSKS
jgi:hypothetical protein